MQMIDCFFFFKQKTAYEMDGRLEFRRVLFRSLRPAVHWFTFSRLCVLGRDSGFGQFYSPLDLLKEEDPIIAGKWWRRLLLRPLQRNPWLRALALTQVGHGI